MTSLISRFGIPALVVPALVALAIAGASPARADATFDFTLTPGTGVGGSGVTSATTDPSAPNYPSPVLSSLDVSIDGITFTLANEATPGTSSLTYGGAGFSDIEFVGSSGGATLGLTALTYTFFDPTGAVSTGAITGIVVPEPATFAVLGLGLAGLIAARRRA